MKSLKIKRESSKKFNFFFNKKKNYGALIYKILLSQEILDVAHDINKKK